MKDCNGHNCQHAEPEQHSAECIAELECSCAGIQPLEVVTYFASMLGLTTEQMVKWAAKGKANSAKLAGYAPHVQDRTGMRWWDVVCAMPRYSFWRGEQGNGIVNRVSDPSGNWVEVSAVEAMIQAIDIAFRQLDSGCTDERPCVNCFSGQGPCLDKQSRAAQSVLAERRRQVEVEGRTPDLDDQYPGGQLACAAIAYLMVGVNPNGAVQWWPWDVKTFKASPDTRSNLVKAGALLLADIEWLDRRLAKLAELAKQEPLDGRVCSKVSAVTAEADDLTQFLEQTDFDAAEKVANDTVANQRELPAGEDDCEGCKI